MRVKKVIIPAAGFGTRFLPQTKAMPKEMLPVVDRPVIQYVVEEAVGAGVKDVILVTGWHKRAIEDHFDYPYELVKRLEDWGKEAKIDSITNMLDMANFTYVRQKGPYGNATPVRNCKHIVQDEPFLVLWGDEFVDSTPSRVERMLEVFENYNTSVICGYISDNDEDYDKYAFVDGYDMGNGVWKVNRLIEKPGKTKAPSKLAIISGYVLTPDIMPILDNQTAGHGGEYVLAEAIDTLAQEKNVYAVVLDDFKYYDTGNKLTYMKTTIEKALQHPEIADDLKKYIKGLDLS